MSICFVRAWYWWSLVSSIVDWLSQLRIVAGSVILKICDIKERSQRASFVACVAAMYSDSVVDRETISCRLADQETAPPLTINAYPVIARLSSAILPSVEKVTLGQKSQ